MELRVSQQQVLVIQMNINCSREVLYNGTR